MEMLIWHEGHGVIQLFGLPGSPAALALVVVRWLCCVLVSIPACLMAVRQVGSRWSAEQTRVLVWLAGFLLAFMSLEHLPPVWPFQRTLWQRMILQGGCALLFLLLIDSPFRRAARFAVSPEDWRASATMTVALLIFVVVRSMAIRYFGLGGGDGGVSVEFLVYQLTIPGIAEELFYRALIQPSLNQVFGHRWRVLGAKVGWGWVVTSVVFWAVHAFRLEEQRLFFYWPTVTMQLIAGLAYGWIRERCDSIVPAIAAHNLVNVVWTLV
jgi:membrane protease YdiL (CAAX protease family)